ncbi:acetyltransferase [Pontixanthobacter gangjinensis]|uniref:Acetyltransferase n=1 Tax=Christiangramia aestuarii TaxID=1028746 RepID=A0A7M3SWR4_9FLAO|nr:acetyltransferase [Christiangramia aestuarii]MUP41045.1 acetyltransferase [Christiangramia aestuarii]
MILYGASGHAKVLIDIAHSIGATIDFIVDDDKTKTELLGFPIVHQMNGNINNLDLVIAIGDNQTRKKIADQINNPINKALIHENARVSIDTRIDEGSVVMSNSVINPSVSIGRHCIINTSAVIEHDSQISDFAHISPGAIITGNVKIGEGTQVGAGATIIPGVEIGKWVTIGAGAVVLKNIPDYAVVVGTPGRIIKFNNSHDE